MKIVWERSDIKAGVRYRKIARPAKTDKVRDLQNEIWRIGYLYCSVKKGNVWASISETDFFVMPHDDILKRLNSGYEIV